MSEAHAPKILVIEDETTQRILAKEYLEASGYVVRLADDGRRGLEMAGLLKPDLIILDLLLPSLDGYTLCSRLKQDPATADIPVILVTASRAEDVIERGLAVGASDFVTKPVDWSYLADRVAHVMQQSEGIKRLTAEKQAREEELRALLDAKQGTMAAPASLNVGADGGADGVDTISREEFEKHLQAVQFDAEERVNKIVAAAQEKIQSEQEARRLETEYAAQKMETMARSFWSVIAATSEPQISMLTSLDQLTSGALDDDAAADADFFPVTTQRENAVQSLLSSARNLKMLSQHMTGAAQLNETPVDLVALIHEIVAYVRPNSEHLKLVVESDVPDVPVHVVADEARVRYVVLSMIMNAFKFCPPKGTVRAVLSAKPGQSIQLRVEDNGLGMAPALVETLQDSAAFPANALSQRDGRLGFGVPISMAIMALHQGSLDISSQVGEGTSVTLHFPEARKCVDAEADTADVPSTMSA